MNNFVRMQIIQTLENLSCHFREVPFRDHLLRFQHVRERASVHILEHKRNLTSPVGGSITTDDVRGTGAAKDVHFRDDLLPHCQFMLLLNDLESVNFAGSSVLNLVNLAATAAAQDAKLDGVFGIHFLSLLRSVGQPASGGQRCRRSGLRGREG